MHVRLLPLLSIAGLLTACAAAQQPAPLDVRAQVPPRGGVCDAGPAQSAIGKAGTASNVEAARVASGALMARTLSPGQMVTQEFTADRLNLGVDGSGKITTARCG